MRGDGSQAEGSEPPAISVCIVTGRRTTLLARCLESLHAQERPPSFEVLVCADRDPEVRATVRARFPHAYVVANHGGFPGSARNPLIDEARGELLLFVDDDITLRPDMLRRLHDLATAHPECTVFGGPNATPPGSSSFQVVQGAVLASIVGSGPVRRRYGAHPSVSADERWFTLCNLAIRRPTMVPFDEDLRCAEENAVLAELRRRGEPMLYDPELVVFHERRPTIRGFAAQMFKYGRGRGELLLRDPSSVRLAHAAPVVLVLYLTLLAGATALGWLPVGGVLPLAAYLLIVAIGAAVVAHSVRSARSAPLAAALILILHLEYGAGILTGLAVPRRWATRHNSRARAVATTDATVL